MSRQWQYESLSNIKIHYGCSFLNYNEKTKSISSETDIDEMLIGILNLLKINVC